MTDNAFRNLQDLVPWEPKTTAEKPPEFRFSELCDPTSFAPVGEYYIVEPEVNYWIWTNSGKEFSYNYTDPDTICIEDIAAALSKNCRYAGHLKELYPVSDHCCNLVEYEESQGVTDPHYLLGVLLHDASEAYLTDIPAPAKKLLPDYKVLENRIQSAIYTKFGIVDDEEFHRHLNHIDKNIVRDEAELLFPVNPTWTGQFEFLGAEIIVSKNHNQARKRYLELFYELTSRINDMEEVNG